MTQRSRTTQAALTSRSHLVAMVYSIDFYASLTRLYLQQLTYCISKDDDDNSFARQVFQQLT